ncbi:MAG TPA: YafY family protein [Pedobacter sp.]|jgi:predicted DNA-binding transcriptional regulator YafY
MDAENLNRFDRIVAILIHLQSRRVVKAQDLADRFGVSLRTIYRDIKSLEASGVPIAGEAGVGYSMMDGYRLPPVMFSREEAGSFVAAEKLMQKFSDKTLGAYYQSAMFKIKSVLKGSAKDRVAQLEEQIWINSDQEIFNEHTPDALDVLLDSIAEKRQIALKYQSSYSDELVDRIIEPLGVFNENNYWYVMAYCLLRLDYRHFRTDRMFQIRRTSAPFTKDHHDSIEDYKITKQPEQNTKVVLLVSKDIARYLKAERKYYGFTSEKLRGDKVEMTFMCSEACDGMARWFLMFGDKSEIIEPDSLRIKVGELIEKIQDKLQVTVS